MDLEGRTESNSRSLHWAPLRSWNLFSGRVRSRLPKEPPSAQLSRSQYVRNNAEGGRAGSSTSRSSGRPRWSEADRKGGGLSRRDHKQVVREGSHRQGEVSIAHDYVPLYSSESSGTRPVLRGRSLEASNVRNFDHTARPSEQIVHHQQHHHQDHHHHHYHYRHLYRQPPRGLNGQQGQDFRTTSISEMGSSSHENSNRRRYLAELEAAVPNNSRVRRRSRNAAIEARGRLDERLRGASFLRDRDPLGGLLDGFSVVVEEEETSGDDEVWELGIQDWLSTLGHGEGDPSDLRSSPDQYGSVYVGLSKAAIKNLPKEIFMPQTGRRGEQVRDALMELEDCAVCLERFQAGQLLIRLPCEHRFHPDCLTPWLESRGQCPYCRSKIGDDSICEVNSWPSTSASISRINDNLMSQMGLTDS